MMANKSPELSKNAQ